MIDIDKLKKYCERITSAPVMGPQPLKMTYELSAPHAAAEDTLELIKAMEVMNRRIAFMVVQEEKALEIISNSNNRIAEAYWERDEHGGGWNECRFCNKGPIKNSTLKTYPHDEECPGSNYTGDFEG